MTTSETRDNVPDALYLFFVSWLAAENVILHSAALPFYILPLTILHPATCHPPNPLIAYIAYKWQAVNRMEYEMWRLER